LQDKGTSIRIGSGVNRAAAKLLPRVL
jgi:hypothetical protein